MTNMKKVVLLVIGIYVLNIGFGQVNINFEIFKNLCLGLVDLNEDYCLKSNISSIQILIDLTEDYNCIIDTFKELSDKERELLDSVSYEKLFEILVQEYYNIIPLSDTILIYDTLGFFCDEYTFTTNRYNFILSKDISLYRSMIINQLN